MSIGSFRVGSFKVGGGGGQSSLEGGSLAGGGLWGIMRIPSKFLGTLDESK